MQHVNEGSQRASLWQGTSSHHPPSCLALIRGGCSQKPPPIWQGSSTHMICLGPPRPSGIAWDKGHCSTLHLLGRSRRGSYLPHLTTARTRMPPTMARDLWPTRSRSPSASGRLNAAEQWRAASCFWGQNRFGPVQTYGPCSRKGIS